jgi:hypothetical protein
VRCAGTNDRSARILLFLVQAAPDGAPRTSSWEALIRTLGVGLIAIAAIVASLTVVRQRQEDARPPEGEKRPQHSPPSSRLDLDQLRAAGM